MEPTRARSGRRFVFTTISFLLPVRLPLPPRFAALPSSLSLSTTIIQSRLHSSSSSSSAQLSSPSPGDSFITAAAAILAAPSTISRCGSNVYPLLAAGIESAALGEERAGQQEEQDLQQGATFYAVPSSSSGSKLDANEGRSRDATADPSQIDKGSRCAATTPASLTGRERWQRARQAGVARFFGRVFRARGLRRGIVRPPSSTTASEVNLQGGVASRGPFSRWRRWRRLLLPRRSGHPTVEAPRAAMFASAAAVTAAAEEEAEAAVMVVVVERDAPVPQGGGMGSAREGGVEGDEEARAAAQPGVGAEADGVVDIAGERDGAAVDATSVGSVHGGSTDDVVEEGGSMSSERATRPATYDGEDVSPEAWAKVDEIRRRAESCDPKAEEAKGLQLWLASGGKGREGLTDTDILRFVMFRHGNVEAAWQQLKLAATWRQEYRVDDILSEKRWAEFKELQEEIFWIGRDSGGRPTMALRSIAHLPGRIDSEEFQRYFLYLLEQGRQLWGVGSVRQMNIVVDRVGAGLKNQDPRLLSTMLPVFRDAYPDIVYRCYVAPTSWIFRFVWIIAARLVDDRQRKRVLLLLGEWKLRLLEDFDASTLPLHLGGTMDAYPPAQPPIM